MRISRKWWVLALTLVLNGCVSLPFNGIVTITPAAVPDQSTPTAASTSTSLPATHAPIQPTLPLPVTNTPGVTQMPPVLSTPESTVLQGLVEKASLDLSKRLSISVTDITLVQASEVSWADLSLGCPKPGMMYGQMITSGYQIILSAGSTRYDYHAGPDAAPFYCEKPQGPIEGNPAGIQ